MSDDFSGEDNKKTKFRKFTREAIWKSSEDHDDATPAIAKIREDLWIVMAST